MNLEKANSTYIGDGAYASFDGFQFRVFTSNGIEETNEVFFLDPDVLFKFMLFVKAQGFTRLISAIAGGSSRPQQMLADQPPPPPDQNECSSGPESHEKSHAKPSGDEHLPS